MDAYSMAYFFLQKATENKSQSIPDENQNQIGI